LLEGARLLVQPRALVAEQDLAQAVEIRHGPDRRRQRISGAAAAVRTRP
jgi:hypothetical protein